MQFALHIGAHRTGTTALQQALTRGRGALEAGGVAFWGPQAMRRPGFQDFASRLRQAELRPELRGELAAAKAEMAEAFGGLERAGRRLLLVSEENLLGTMERNFAEGILYPGAAEKLAAFGELFPQAPATVYLAVRDYAEYWASAYAHCLLYHVMPEFEAEELAAAVAGRGWPDVAADVARAFPGARVVVWRHGKAKGTLRRVLAAMLGAGVAEAVAPPGEGVNASLSARALEDFAALGRVPSDLSPRERREAVARLRAVGGPAIRPFAAALEAELAARFERDWERLRSGAVAGVEALDPAAGEAAA